MPTKLVRPFLDERNDAFLIAVPFLAMIRDSTALLKAAGNVEKLVNRDTTARQRAVSQYVASSLRAYAALANGDTVTRNSVVRRATRHAGDQHSVRPVHACASHRPNKIRGAQSRSSSDMAVADLLYPARELERGRLAERIGDKERAVDAYSFVATVWQQRRPGSAPRRREGSERRAEATGLRWPPARAARLGRKALSARCRRARSHCARTLRAKLVAASSPHGRMLAYARLRSLRLRRCPPSSSSRSTRSAIDFSIAIRFRILRRLAAEGVRAPFRPEFPSKTFPNHYSMATGLTPGQHGITINQFFDPIRGEWFRRTSANDGSFFKGEPIWVTAEKAGIRTAAYFWTGSEAEIGGVRPTFWFPFDATVPDYDQGRVRSCSGCDCLTAERPHLIMMYSGVVDVPGHRYGPESPEAFAGVRAADRTLGALRDSLAQFASLGIDLIVVSDHGLVAVPREHDIDMDSLLPPRGALVDDEHATFSIWADPRRRAESRFARRGVSTQIPHMRVFRPGEFPAEWETEQNRRLGDLFLLADPGYEFVGTNPRAIYTLGEHGYDPKTPEMMGIFLAAGPDFRKGVRLGARENRTLHDLLVRLLRLPAARTTTVSEFGLRNSYWSVVGDGQSSIARAARRQHPVRPATSNQQPK